MQKDFSAELKDKLLKLLNPSRSAEPAAETGRDLLKPAAAVTAAGVSMPSVSPANTLGVLGAQQQQNPSDLQAAEENDPFETQFQRLTRQMRVQESMQESMQENINGNRVQENRSPKSITPMMPDPVMPDLAPRTVINGLLPADLQASGFQQASDFQAPASQQPEKFAEEPALDQLFPASEQATQAFDELHAELRRETLKEDKERQDKVRQDKEPEQRPAFAQIETPAWFAPMPEPISASESRQEEPLLSEADNLLAERATLERLFTESPSSNDEDTSAGLTAAAAQQQQVRPVIQPIPEPIQKRLGHAATTLQNEAFETEQPFNAVIQGDHLFMDNLLTEAAAINASSADDLTGYKDLSRPPQYGVDDIRPSISSQAAAIKPMFTPASPNKSMINSNEGMTEKLTMTEKDFSPNVQTLIRLVSDLPEGVTKQTGAQIIRLTMEAMGISMEEVLSEAQSAQSEMLDAVRANIKKIEEYKTVIRKLENDIKFFQGKANELSEIIDLFILSNASVQKAAAAIAAAPVITEDLSEFRATEEEHSLI